MKKSLSKRQFLLGAVAVSSLALFGCGGTVSAPTSSLRVTPALGAVYGATVSVYNARGVLLGTGTTDGTTGKANVTLTGYTAGTPVIIKVTLVEGSSYYDERTATDVVIGTGESVSLLSVMPAIVSGQAVGVTPLTNLAAALTGLTADAVGTSTFAAVTTDAIYSGIAQTLLALGLPLTISLTAEPDAASATNPVPGNLMGKILSVIADGSGDPLANALALVQLVVGGVLTSGDALTAAHTLLSDTALRTEYVLPVELSDSILSTDPQFQTILDQAKNAVKDVIDSELVPATGTGSGTTNGG